MHPYTVKNYLWLAIIAMLLIVFLLSGCSSAPKVKAQKPQYCHTSQEILVRNGEKVDSATLVECTDDEFKRLTAVRMGMADHCGISRETVRIGEKYFEVETKSCMVLDPNGKPIGFDIIR